MASISFLINRPYEKDDSNTGKKKLKKKQVTLSLYVIQSKEERLLIGTPIKVFPVDWDFDKQEVKAKGRNATSINTALMKIRLEISNIISQAVGQNWSVIEINIKRFFNKVSVIDSFVYAGDYMEQWIKVSMEELDEKTISRYRNMVNHFKTFQDKVNYKYKINELGLSFYDQFKIYLQTEPENRFKGKGLLDSSVVTNIAKLKAFLRWSYERGYHNNTDFIKFKATMVRKNDDDIALTVQELRKIHDFEFPLDSNLDKVRDVFCFLCFTGQRYSDIIAFNKNDISIEDKTWVFTQQKSKNKKPVKMILPFEGYLAPAWDILEKYNFELPKYEEPVFNRIVKRVAEEAGISGIHEKFRHRAGKKVLVAVGPKWKFISSHTGRRTATTLLLEILPPTYVMKITGHEKLETIMSYDKTKPDAVKRMLKNTAEFGTAIMKVAK